MKMTHIFTLTLLFLVLGCKREVKSVQPPPTESKTFSDGSFTWHLGAMTQDGTNVPLSNVTIRVKAITNKVSQ